MSQKHLPADSLSNNSLFFKSISFILFLSLPTLFLNATLENDKTSPRQQEKARITQEVYDNIANSIQDSRKAPTLNFVFSEKPEEPYYNAYYNPKNNTINFGEGIYDITTTFGPDSLNALAMVIGHELAHYFKDHGWGMAFGLANEETAIAQKIYDLELNADRRAEMEAEADYFGGLFGRMAGYNTLSIGGDFFKRLYKTIELPDTVPGYPTLQDRMDICTNSYKSLAGLVPVFKAANMLSLTSRHEKAAICYDHIINIFPSREMYNNEGVSLTWAALEHYTPEELRYAYPFGLDMDTRLEGPSFFARPGGQTPEELRKELLKKAVKSFEKAIQLDEEYAPAYINLALANLLLDEQEMGMALAGKAIKLTKKGENPLLLANAQIARGIAYALAEDSKNAKKAFEEAKNGNAVFAEANAGVLKDKKFAKILKNKAGEKQTMDVAVERESIARESIVSFEGLYDAREDFPSVTIRKQNENRPRTTIYAVNEEEFDALMIETSGGYLAKEKDVEGFIITKPNYKGQTYKKIAIGSTLQEVHTAYGTAQRFVSGTSTNFHYYAPADNSKIGLIFMTNHNDLVTGWALYGDIYDPAIK